VKAIVGQSSDNDKAICKGQFSGNEVSNWEAIVSNDKANGEANDEARQSDTGETTKRHSALEHDARRHKRALKTQSNAVQGDSMRNKAIQGNLKRYNAFDKATHRNSRRHKAIKEEMNCNTRRFKAMQGDTRR
jgi:hypothetical protein